MSPTFSNSFQAPVEFDDAAQMVEWLILIESKLQPEQIVVGNFVRLRKSLRDLQVSQPGKVGIDSIQTHVPCTDGVLHPPKGIVFCFIDVICLW